MSAPIFSSNRPGNHGRALSDSGIWLLVTSIAARAGLPALRPHDLRRTFAQTSQDGGADLTTIKHALGHSSVQTTERYLSQVVDLRKGHAAGDHIKMKRTNTNTTTSKETK